MLLQMFQKFKKIIDLNFKNKHDKVFLGLVTLGVFLLVFWGIFKIVNNYYNQEQDNDPVYSEEIIIEDDSVEDDSDIEVTTTEPNSIQMNLDKICECEKEFKTSYPIEWSGYVIAMFSSGEDIGVKRFDQSGEYKQFYVRGDGKYDGGEKVRVKGDMIGITCAYYNTIFGECVPNVIANSIEVLK